MIVQPLGAQAAPLGAPPQVGALSITSRADLSKAVSAYMNRTDLDPAMDSFIIIAEGRIALDLRTWQMVKTIDQAVPAADGYFTVPADWLEWDRIYCDMRPLDYQARDLFWSEHANGCAGQVSSYTMTGDRLYLAAPNTSASAADLPVKASYYARIPALNDTDPAPWLMAQYPQVYLYSTMVSACEYVKDEARAQSWASQYQAVVTTLNSQSYKATVSGSTWRQVPRR